MSTDETEYTPLCSAINANKVSHALTLPTDNDGLHNRFTDQ